jgi:hypothetical protein
VVLLTTFFAAGCDDNPTGPSGLSGQVTVQTVAIGGLSLLQQPGDVLQLTASATFSDGSTRDVTTEASWASLDGAVVRFLAPAGRLVANWYGETAITATFQSVQARADVRVAPAGMFLVSGRVTEDGRIAVADATVSVMQSDGAVVQTRTTSTGNFVLIGAGAIILRVEKDGFVAEEHGETIAQDTELDIELERILSIIEGVWALTFTASPSCTSLPEEVRRRQYTATITERGRVEVAISGANMEAFGDAGFTGIRTGDRVTFLFVDDNYDDFIFVERIDPQRNLGLSGTAEGAVAEATIEAVFNGKVELRAVTGGPIAECRAADHHLTFTR